jgi:hypothetical protein
LFDRRLRILDADGRILHEEPIVSNALTGRVYGLDAERQALGLCGRLAGAREARTLDARGAVFSRALFEDGTLVSMHWPD